MSIHYQVAMGICCFFSRYTPVLSRSEVGKYYDITLIDHKLCCRLYVYEDRIEFSMRDNNGQFDTQRKAITLLLADPELLERVDNMVRIDFKIQRKTLVLQKQRLRYSKLTQRNKRSR